MGKKRVFIDPKTGKEEVWDTDDFGTFTGKDYIKAGMWGKKLQYKYFCKHPEEIEDQKLFSELEEEFGDDNTEKIN